MVHASSLHVGAAQLGCLVMAQCLELLGSVLSLMVGAGSEGTTTRLGVVVKELLTRSVVDIKRVSPWMNGGINSFSITTSAPIWR